MLSLGDACVIKAWINKSQPDQQKSEAHESKYCGLFSNALCHWINNVSLMQTQQNITCLDLLQGNVNMVKAFYVHHKWICICFNRYFFLRPSDTQSVNSCKQSKTGFLKCPALTVCTSNKGKWSQVYISHVTR